MGSSSSSSSFSSFERRWVFEDDDGTGKGTNPSKELNLLLVFRPGLDVNFRMNHLPKLRWRLQLLLSLVWIFVLSYRLGADAPASWPHWRGPRDNGSAEAGHYPVKWDATTNLLWKAALPGKGCS